jgi:hypothetical protein
VFGFLEQQCGTTVAFVGTALWYATLVLAVLYCAFEPQAEFSYLRF